MDVYGRGRGSYGVSSMRSILGLIDSDLEGVIKELEGMCSIREYLVLKAMWKAVTLLEKVYDPKETLTVFKSILHEALMGAEGEIEKYGIYLSDNAVIIAMEAEWEVEQATKAKKEKKKVEPPEPNS